MRYILSLLASLPLVAAPFGQKEQSISIKMTNRPLVSLHGKVITLYDVVKDMDKKMADVAPEALLSPVSRVQFYSANWKHALDQMVQNSLIIKEGEDLGIKISDAQLYEEVDNQFGPNVMQTLNERGLTYEEAKKEVYETIVLNYMQWIRIHQKASQNITPEKMQTAYANYLKEHPPIETFSYQIVSVRSDKDPYEALAERISPFLHNSNIEDVDGLIAKLKQGPLENSTIQVSKPFNLNAKEMSSEHISILSTLAAKSCSEPKVQYSRKDGSMLMRIFYLIDHQKDEPPSFEQLENYLKGQLNQQEIQKAQSEYISKLKKRYHCDKADFYRMIPENYQPFSLE
ncbi:MAG: hypothetical protein FJZ56_00940 [Chlamydiae bacterium]|nr:hypothetical protein [Chlamydiota bacterium]